MNTVKEKDTHFYENEKIPSTTTTPVKYQIVYASVVIYVYLNLAATYGLYLSFTKAKWMTLIFAHFFILYLGWMGITVGVHRLWSHKSFKAKLPLELFLMICNTLACQYTAYNWVRDHRLHHKYSDTNADPYNSSRGFFFAHIGWVMVKKHPDVKKLGVTIDMEDIRSNPLLSFQKRNAKWFLPTVGFLIPTIIPVLLWNEDFSTAWHLNILRYVINLNMVGSVNSIAHTWGYKPYDSSMRACQNLCIAILTCGEGYHNFHHAFPYDYRVSEKGNTKANVGAMFIDICSNLGLAYDLKEATEEIILKRKIRTGDGTDLWGDKNTEQ